MMFHIYNYSSGKIAYFNRPIFLVYCFFDYVINDRISSYESYFTWLEALMF